MKCKGKLFSLSTFFEAFTGTAIRLLMELDTTSVEACCHVSLETKVFQLVMFLAEIFRKRSKKIIEQNALMILVIQAQF